MANEFPESKKVSVAANNFWLHIKRLLGLSKQHEHIKECKGRMRACTDDSKDGNYSPPFPKLGIDTAPPKRTKAPIKNRNTKRQFAFYERFVDY